MLRYKIVSADADFPQVLVKVVPGHGSMWSDRPEKALFFNDFWEAYNTFNTVMLWNLPLRIVVDKANEIGYFVPEPPNVVY